jgi:putative transposase
MVCREYKLPIEKQCNLLMINRSTFYYTPAIQDDSVIANQIADCYRQYPIYGYRRITVCLQREGYIVNHKCVLRIMQEIGLRAIYPGPKTTIVSKEHHKYAYMLRNLVINCTNQVWQVDITYLRTEHGFIYLNALIDVHSRYIVGWTLSNSLDTESCLRTLENAILNHGIPEIINSDHGCQFTCEDWICSLTTYGISISMSGIGRSNDNAHIERLWRTLKYESVILNNPRTVADYKKLVPEFISWYNNERPHQALKYQTPAEVFSTQTLQEMILVDQKSLCKNKPENGAENSLNFNQIPS